ncbi:GntR family transcriptional regulator [Oricola thermophila]|uniref:GntR family transcriptional regulator n=1 Tax=Oricola thermophila TaxID=2742145 RepID=A0A6N1VCS0_9HYPH|nr:GntR family transcriptional regulator [Oricola thermophila]QKV18851.1 GntR family transcriptional regulator [Oricola thermophila]
MNDSNHTGFGGATARSRKPRAPNAPPASHTTIAGTKNSDIVYRDLRSAIIAMELTPGTVINEKELTQRYGISRTPVREALLRLSEDRLLDVVPKSGTFVARIPLSAVREALVARRALEAVTVREATARASESQFIEMRAIIQRQRETAAAGDEAAFHNADDDFHAAIAAAARLPGIWDMIQQIRVQIERYRRLTLPQPGRMAMVVGEHEAVLEAMTRNDADTAVERMAHHLNKLQLDIAVFRDMWPDYFVFDPAVDSELLEE